MKIIGVTRMLKFYLSFIKIVNILQILLSFIFHTKASFLIKKTNKFINESISFEMIYKDDEHKNPR